MPPSCPPVHLCGRAAEALQLDLGQVCMEWVMMTQHSTPRSVAQAPCGFSFAVFFLISCCCFECDSQQLRSNGIVCLGFVRHAASCVVRGTKQFNLAINRWEKAHRRHASTQALLRCMLSPDHCQKRLKRKLTELCSSCGMEAQNSNKRSGQDTVESERGPLAHRRGDVLDASHAMHALLCCDERRRRTSATMRQLQDQRRGHARKPCEISRQQVRGPCARCAAHGRSDDGTRVSPPSRRRLSLAPACFRAPPPAPLPRLQRHAPCTTAQVRPA